MFISIEPQHKTADLCAFLAGASFTISFATVVEIVQLLAGLIAVVSGALSLYFRFFAKPKKQRRRGRR